MKARAILEYTLIEAEDPKDFLRQQRNRLPGRNEVDYDFEADPEDYSEIDGSFSEEADVQWVKDQLNAGNHWAWFRAKVTAKWTDPVTEREYEGHDYLGGCSYLSRADFMKDEPGYYYHDMKNEAYERLCAEIEAGREGAE